MKLPFTGRSGREKLKQEQKGPKNVQAWNYTVHSEEKEDNKCITQ